jgi:hypothetical protein
VLQFQNVHFPGAKPPTSLAGHLHAFVAGITPYKGSVRLQDCQPAMTFDYPSAERMVLASLRCELEEHLSLANSWVDLGELVRNIDQSVAESRRPAQLARCVETTRKDAWDSLVAQTSRVIERSLAEKRRGTEASGRQPIHGPMGHE